MPIIQETIHKVEVAGGMRYMRVGLVVLAVLAATVLYNFRCFRNFGTQEAMDSAQLARNIATGKGYTTSFIRPFSMFLLRRHAEDNGVQAQSLGDLTRVKERHPDISNPPVYPMMLAGLMKILPFKYPIPEKPRTFWSDNGRFARYQPDFLISAFNQLIFFGVIVAVFFLAARLFDRPTAWLSAGLLFGADILWRFSISGLSTMLLVLFFVAIAWCLVLLEESLRDENRGFLGFVVISLFLGLFCGLGMLTRYSFGCLIVPVMLFLILVPPRYFTLPGSAQLAAETGVSSRLIGPTITFVMFLIVTVPWIVRNFKLTGTPFGTAGYFIYDGTALFGDNKLGRSLQPDLPQFSTLYLKVLAQKLFANMRGIVQSEAPHLGGGFIGLFFLVGLFIAQPNTGAARLRYFLVGTLPVLVFAQALGRTHLSDDSLEINSENLLIIVAPLVIMFGVQFAWLLINQLHLPMRQLRYAVIGLFCFLMCLPAVFSFLPPRPSPLAYPPYLPPYIQRAASFVKPDELIMSDIPWATAWYGNVSSVWLTEGSDAFADIDSLQKPIKELYFTQVTLNSHFLSQWVGSPDGWGYLLMRSWESALREGPWPKEINLAVNRLSASPAPLSLHYMQIGWPQECLLTFRKNPVSE